MKYKSFKKIYIFLKNKDTTCKFQWFGDYG